MISEQEGPLHRTCQSHNLRLEEAAPRVDTHLLSTAAKGVPVKPCQKVAVRTESSKARRR